MPKIPGKQIQLDSNPELGTSDVVVSSQKAIKEYVDTRVASNAAVIYTSLIPAGTPSPAVITHNLNSFNYFVNVYDNVTKEDIVVNIDRVDAFNVEIDYASNPNDFMVLIFSTALVEPAAGTSGYADVGILAVDNGLTSSGGVGKLGGELLQDTLINGDFALNLGADGDTINGFTVYSATNIWEQATDGTTVGYLNLQPEDFGVGSFRATGQGAKLIGTNGGSHHISLSVTTDTAEETYFRVLTDSMRVNSNVAGFSGIEYQSDYSANYTNRSLVDKEYVDNLVGGGGGWTLNGSSTFTGNVNINMDTFAWELYGTGTGTGAAITVTDTDFEQAFIISPPVGIDLYQTIPTGTARVAVTNNNAYLRSQNTTGNIVTSLNVVASDADRFVHLQVDDGNTDKINSFRLGHTTITLRDDRTAAAGIEYFADYSATYTNRSLVDKEYVDTSNTVAIETITTDTTLTEDSGFVNADSTGGELTITLPATPKTGQQITIHDYVGNAAADNIIISGNGNDINGVGAVYIGVNFNSIIFTFNGTVWSAQLCAAPLAYIP